MPTKPDKIIPALYGGIIIAIISAIPGLNLINCLCCAGVMLGGLMAVYFYKNNLRADQAPLESSDGVQLGLLSGVFGAVISTILSVIIQLLLGNVAAEMLYGMIDKLGNVPPEIIGKFQEKMDEGITVGSIFLSFFVTLIIYPVFGLFGGLIGYSTFKRRQPPFSYTPPAPPSQPIDPNIGM